jgi:ribonuclease HI
MLGFFDGACEPMNPGGVATYGFVIFGDGGARLASGCGVAAALRPCATNNYAEYTGLIKLLESALRLGGRGIVVKGDSQLVVRQVNGEYAVRSGNILPLYREAVKLVEALGAKVVWVPREENREADALSHTAYEEFMDRHPEVASSLRHHLATEKQVALLRSLGIEAYRYMGRMDASRLIRRHAGGWRKALKVDERGRDLD